AWITYSGQESAHHTVTVKTFKVDLLKTDGEEELDGATFKLYKATKETVENKEVYTKTGEAIDLIEIEGGYAVADSTAEVMVTDINVGHAVIKGLGNGDYCFEETVAPEGYNKLPSVVGFTINNENHAEIEVVNQSGATLPGTGGVGTTMFYVLGSVMMIGAAVLLVTKKKMANEQ
ncbi:MAG: LPXTG cell wall anchor domain-containing protein, partial [Clostridia bacterium]|nr:LPXTG cell wall anchor domain-containing protein [Clostridia bacterium]